jgi:hypothetical protein
LRGVQILHGTDVRYFINRRKPIIQIGRTKGLQANRAGADQVSEPFTLIGVQDRVDLFERLLHGDSEAFGALDAKRAPFACLGLVEDASGQGVCEC